MNYSLWEERRIAVADLTLDALNPRIPVNGKIPSQKELIVELVENDKVYELAELIVENGYLPDQYLIVVREDGRLVVVEGNRRLSAVKLLLNPHNAPTDYQRRFSTLSERIDPSTISELKTLIAPSREAAIPLIVSKHTDPSVEEWAPIMQANFYARQIKGGVTVEKLSEAINVSPTDIREALFTAGLYAEARKLRLSVNTKQVVDNPRTFPMSTLIRLTARPVGRQFLGLQQNAKGKVKSALAKKTFNKRFGRIVSDIASGIKNSRNLNTDLEIRSYFEEINGKKFVSGKLPSPPTRKFKLTTKAKISKSLIPSSFHCDSKNDRIKEVVIELKRIPLEEFPNGVAVLLRVALELGAYQYLLDLKELDPWKRELAAGGYTKWDMFPSLTPMLKRIADKDLVDPNLKRSIKTFVGKTDPLIDELNLYVHNGTYIPSPSDLRAHWKKLSALLKLFFENR